MKKIIAVLFLGLLALWSYLPSYAGTLADISKKGYLRCGISTGLAGFSSVDSKGVWQGIDVDICRAVAAAVFGDDRKVKYVPLTAKERFAALQSGEIDLLSRNTTWTTTRDTALGLTFAGITYYDGQGFMVKKSLGVKRLKELNGATFCVQPGTTTELNLADYFRTNRMRYKIITTEGPQLKRGFESNRCDALTTDQSGLYAIRSTLKDPESALILSEIISKEPLGPMVRDNDIKWLNVVRWTLNVLIAAEELGLNKKNVLDKTNNPEINRLLGRTGQLHKGLGLDKNWAKNIITQVGNYANIFEKNLGKNTPLKIKRGLNTLWKDGGLLYSPPFK